MRRADSMALDWSGWVRSHQGLGRGVSSSRRPSDAVRTPRATLSQLHSSRTRPGSALPTRRRSAGGSASHRLRRSAIATTAPSSIGNESRSRSSAGSDRGQLASHLAHARVIGADREHPARRRLSGDHPEGLGEGAGEDERVGGWHHTRHVVVLEATRERYAAGRVAGPLGVALRGRGEERVEDPQRDRLGLRRDHAFSGDPPRGVHVAGVERREQVLDHLASLAERDHEQPRARVGPNDERPRREQQVESLGADQLSDEDRPGAIRSGPALQSRGGHRSVLAPLPRPGPRRDLRGQGAHRGDRVGRRCGGEQPRVHPGRPESRLGGQLGVVERLPQDIRSVPRADQDARRGVGALARVGQEPAGVLPHGELERAAVDDGRESHPAAGEDQRAHHEVVRERCVDPASRRDDVGRRGDVGGDVGVELVVGELGERLDLEALVAVVHVHGEKPADVRDVGGDGAGMYATGLGLGGANPELSPFPVARSIDPRQLSRAAVLAHQVDVVAESRERLREARVVDVAAGPAQQIAVEDQYPPRAPPRVRRGGGHCRTLNRRSRGAARTLVRTAPRGSRGAAGRRSPRCPALRPPRPPSRGPWGPCRQASDPLPPG